MSTFLTIVCIAALGYYLSLKIHPSVRCKRCDASNRHYDLVYSGRRTLCPDCGGTGRRQRLGARLFLGGTSRERRLRLESGHPDSIAGHGDAGSLLSSSLSWTGNGG